MSAGAVVVGTGVELRNADLAYVPSATKPGLCYQVNLAKATCTCPDYTWRRAANGTKCKHLVAAEAARSADKAARFARGREIVRRMFSADIQVVWEEAVAEGADDLAACCYQELNNRRWFR